MRSNREDTLRRELEVKNWQGDSTAAEMVALAGEQPATLPSSLAASRGPGTHPNQPRRLAGWRPPVCSGRLTVPCHQLAAEEHQAARRVHADGFRHRLRADRKEIRLFPLGHAVLCNIKNRGAEA